VGDDDRGGARFAQDRKRVGPHRILETGIETGKRLVHQDHGRPRRKRTGQRHALLLAAGQHMRIFVGIMRQPDAAQGVHGLVAGRALLQRRQPEAHIVEDGHMREEREVLKHQADAALLWREENVGTGNFPIVEKNAAGTLRLDAGGDAQQRGLARAGRPEQAQNFARLDRQRQAGQRLLAVIAVGDAFEAEPGGKRDPSGGSGFSQGGNDVVLR
jgi:hypothetical protein